MLATTLALKKAVLETETNIKIPVLFNPDEYKISRTAKYSSHSIPGLDIPIAQFVHGSADMLEMNLFFDTMAAPEGGKGKTKLDLVKTSSLPENKKIDVRKYTQQVYALMAVDGDLHAPPIVTFKWGSLSFKGFIIAVEQKFTKFTYEGVPVRAMLTVTFQSSEKMDAQLRNAPRNSPDRTKFKVVNEKDMLCTYAYEEYGTCGQWREIARANGIENPRLLKSGKTIKIPAIL